MPLFLIFKMFILRWHNIIQQFTIEWDNPQEWPKKMLNGFKKIPTGPPFICVDELFMVKII
jgi:hypothetical protein